MSDYTPAPLAVPTAPTTPPTPFAPTLTPPPEPDATDTVATEGDELAKWKSMARKHEAAAKANATAARRLEQIEAAAKSDLERATERATQAEARAAAMEVDALRGRVASAHGVPVDLITGADEDAMATAARAALAWRDQVTPTRRRPDVASLTSGAAAGATASTTGKDRAASALRGLGGGAA